MASRRKISKTIFGNADRLDVALHIASAESATYATGISDVLGIPPNRVRAQLIAFAEAGVLEALPRGGAIGVFYMRNNEKFWAALRDLARLSNSQAASLHHRRRAAQMFRKLRASLDIPV